MKKNDLILALRSKFHGFYKCSNITSGAGLLRFSLPVANSSGPCPIFWPRLICTQTAHEYLHYYNYY